MTPAPRPSTVLDDGPLPGVEVAVTSDQSLVAEAIRMALANHGFDSSYVPWHGRPRAHADDPRGSPVPRAVLILCDLETPVLVRQTGSVANRWSARSLLLTGAPMGARWGAALALGVDVVMPVSTSLESLGAVLRNVSSDRPAMDRGVRGELLRQYRSAADDRVALLTRMRALTARERAVLRLLHLGQPVGAIAGLMGVSESTVRSHVRAVLRKLEVSTQLAAVSQFDLAQHQFRWEELSSAAEEMSG